MPNYIKVALRVVDDNYYVEEKSVPMSDHLVVLSSDLYNKENYNHDSRRIKAHQYTN